MGFIIQDTILEFIKWSATFMLHLDFISPSIPRKRQRIFFFLAIKGNGF